MSVSINNYYQKYYNNYDLTSGSTDTSKTASTTSGSKTATGTDSVSFSDIAKLFFNFDDESSDSVEAGNDEISALFQSVQSLPLSLSYADIGNGDSQVSGQTSGIPSMLQAMGSYSPPFAWGLNNTTAGTDETAAIDSVNSTQAAGLTSLEAGMTADDILSVLANLQSSLSLLGTGDEASSSTDNPLSTVKAMLSKTNFMTATDSDLSSLFSNVLQRLG